MNMTFYPYPTHLINLYRGICGQHTGILEAGLSANTRTPNDLGICAMYGKIPDYHKITIHPDVTMQYHLTGYGLYFEESLIRLLGEGIERYALIVAPSLLRDRIKYASYRDIKKEGDVIPWELMNIFSDEDYKRLGNSFHVRKLDENSVIGWLACPSLFEAGKEVWMPAQMLLPGYKINLAVNEIRFSSGFSKGAAAHTDFKKALLNAILETIEMDPFIVKWYTMTPSPRIIVDDYTLLKNLPQILGKDSQFEVLPLLMNLEDTPGYVFGAALINKKEKIPFIAFGTQVSLDPVKGLYRALMEAAAITTIGNFGPVYIPESYFKYPGDAPFIDLDKNVAYYLFPQEANKKRDIFKNLTSSSLPLSGMKNLSTGDDSKDIQYLISKLRKISKYAVYLNITPPEMISRGWHVIRVFVPEYATICLPGIPFSQHPRILKYGGVRNPNPHPLP
jgi:thiazole/oxazole-forming peptide maturase SagD family component